MNATDSPTKCAWCGGDLRPRIDPRGRKARYCSGACRAAAARERARKAHQDELERAHQQATLALRTPQEELTDAARVVRALVRDLRSGREFHVTDAHRELIAAVREFADLMAPQAAAQAAPALNRAQRRAQNRRR